MESIKLRHIFQFHQYIFGVDYLEKWNYVKNNLRSETIHRIENGNLDLKIYALVFKDCMQNPDADFDKEVNKRLNDTNYITSLTQK